MKKLFLLFALWGVATTSFSQVEKKQFTSKGLLRATATISPGIMLKENNSSSISIHGNLEYYVADNISLRGDSYYYLQGDDMAGNDPFEFNHSIFAGGSYHIKTKNAFDPYISFSPGVSITRSNAYEVGLNSSNLNVNVSANTRSAMSVNPLLSSGIGFNYFFQKWFHLFAETRYIHGKHLSDAPSPIFLSELRFSFGLGFNINLLKKK